MRPVEVAISCRSSCSLADLVGRGAMRAAADRPGHRPAAVFGREPATARARQPERCRSKRAMFSLRWGVLVHGYRLRGRHRRLEGRRPPPRSRVELCQALPATPTREDGRVTRGVGMKIETARGQVESDDLSVTLAREVRRCWAPALVGVPAPDPRRRYRECRALGPRRPHARHPQHGGSHGARAGHNTTSFATSHARSVNVIVRDRAVHIRRRAERISAVLQSSGTVHRRHRKRHRWHRREGRRPGARHGAAGLRGHARFPARPSARTPMGMNTACDRSAIKMRASISSSSSSATVATRTTSTISCGSPRRA